MKRLKNTIIVTLTVVLLLISCQEVPITGRKQLTLIPSSQIMSMSANSYSQFLQKNSSKVLKGTKEAVMIQRVGRRIQHAVEYYMKSKGLANRLNGFKWEFNLIDDPSVNAWAMSGGKVVFYTGILDVCQSETGVAVVMGHEVAHAIAEHSNERMTQQMAAKGLFTAANIAMALKQNPSKSSQMLMQAAGVGTKLGLLAFSRQQESEADRMGLRFMALAGYDPREAAQLWVRMKAKSGGKAPAQFLSTHPSHDTRIASLKKYAPAEMPIYEAARKKY